MMLLQKAGNVQLRAFTDGYPLRVELSVGGDDDWRELGHFTPDGLHDLRYACERMLAKVSEHEAGER